MALHRKTTETQRRHWSLNRTSYMLIQFLRQNLVTNFINTNNVVWDSLLLSVKWGLKIILNSLGRVTSLPLVGPVAGLPTFSLWTVETVDVELRKYKSNRPRHVKRMNNRMPIIMLNYRPNGWRRLGRLLERLLDEAETGLSRPNWWRMIMMMTNEYSIM